MIDPPSEMLSAVFDAIRRGEEDAEQRLFTLVYDELRRMARGKLRGERSEATLQTTALVNEAYLRLVKKDEQAHWENRQHFFGAAALAMRRILVDRARQRASDKRGGTYRRVTLDERVGEVETSLDLIALDEALSRLANQRKRLAEVVHYRYFLGLTVPETAQLLGVSARTVDTDWGIAKAWLLREMTQGRLPRDGADDGL